MRCLRSLVPRIQALNLSQAGPSTRTSFSNFRSFNTQPAEGEKAEGEKAEGEKADEAEEDEGKAAWRGDEDERREPTSEEILLWMPVMEDLAEKFVARETQGWEEKVRKWDEDYWRRGSPPLHVDFAPKHFRSKVIYWKNPDCHLKGHDKGDQELDYDWHQVDPDMMSDFYADNHKDPDLPPYVTAGRGRRMYIIHRSNPGKWTPRRLANEFNISLEECNNILRAESMGELMKQTLPPMNDYEFYHYVRHYLKDLARAMAKGKKNIKWTLPIPIPQLEIILEKKRQEAMRHDDPLQYETLQQGYKTLEVTEKKWREAMGHGDPLEYEIAYKTLEVTEDPPFLQKYFPIFCDHPNKDSDLIEDPIVEKSGDVGYDLPLDWDWRTSRLDLADDEEVFRKRLLVEEKKLRFLSKSEKLEMAESYVMAQKKYHIGRPIPGTPTRKVGTQRERHRNRWMLVENNKKRDHIFQIAIRDYDGSLRTPTTKELKYIRRKEKGVHRPFVNQEFQPLDTPPNLTKYGPAPPPPVRTPVAVPPLPASRKVPKVWGKKRRTTAASK